MATATTVNYPTPVIVNGFSCKNCTDVDLAKKHIDPAHPKDGPYGIDAKNQPPSPSDPAKGTVQNANSDTPAVTFGGVLAGVSQASAPNVQPSPAHTGQRLNVLA